MKKIILISLTYIILFISVTIIAILNGWKYGGSSIILVFLVYHLWSIKLKKKSILNTYFVTQLINEVQNEIKTKFKKRSLNRLFKSRFTFSHKHKKLKVSKPHYNIIIVLSLLYLILSTIINSITVFLRIQNSVNDFIIYMLVVEAVLYVIAYILLLKKYLSGFILLFLLACIYFVYTNSAIDSVSLIQSALPFFKVIILLLIFMIKKNSISGWNILLNKY